MNNNWNASKENVKMTNVSKSTMAMFAIGTMCRLGFEFAMPVYAIFAFPWTITLLIWAVFIFWQWPVTMYLVNFTKAMEEKRKEQEAAEKCKCEGTCSANE